MELPEGLKNLLKKYTKDNKIDGELVYALDLMVLGYELLEEMQLNHKHNETDEAYRPLGDTYGWCYECRTKVGLNEDPIMDMLNKYQNWK